MKLIIAAAPALAATAAAAGPGKDEPFVEPGTRPNPGEVAGEPDGPRPDDRWADLVLEVDKRGRPTKCRVARSNIRKSEMRFWVCQAFMSDWRTEPKIVDGKAVPQTVRRRTILQGKRH